MDERTKTVLVADDDPFGREICRRRLQKAGYAVREAADGAEALESALAAPPDLVILDARMPARDGASACRRLKAEPATRGVPVLLLTACGVSEARALALDCGADAILAKPAEREALLEAVQRLTADGSGSR